MIERIVIIDQADPVSFYGVNNANMQLIRNLFPKLRMAARGSVIKVIGDDAETAEFEKKIKELEAFCAKYNKLTEEAILDVIKGEKPRDIKGDDVIIYGVNGKPITTANLQTDENLPDHIHIQLTGSTRCLPAQRFASDIQSL